jgi:hypothetical protein
MQTANDCVEPIRRKVTWYISVSQKCYWMKWAVPRPMSRWCVWSRH